MVSWIHDGVQIDCTSDVKNVLEEFFRNQHIVLFWRMSGIASWMTLKSTEVKNSCPDGSVLYWNLFLLPHFPAIVLFHISTDLRSRLPWRRRMISCFDTGWTMGEQSCGSTSVQVLFPMGQFSWMSWQKYVFVVFFWPLIGSQKQIHSFSTHILAEVCDQLVQAMRNSDPLVRMVLVYRFNFNFHFVFTLQITGCDVYHGSNLSVPSNPTFRIRWFVVSWWRILTTCQWLCKLWEFFNVFCHEVLSDVNRCQESCFSTNLHHSILLWKLFHSFLLFLQ